MSRARVPFVDLRRQHRDLGAPLRAALNGTLERSDFILGAAVAEFEGSFARFCGARRCVGTANGSEALHLALRALGIGRGDEVIVPALSFAASAFAVAHAGARPVFADVDPETLVLDPRAAERALTRRTRALLPVHLYGNPAPMDALRRLARRRGLAVVEDACQAHGALYRGRRAGSLGDAGCFSFYPSKNLGALGDGGAVVTSDEALADRLRRLRHYGQRVRYRHEEIGYNSRLDTLQAAALSVKLPRLAAWNAARRRAAALYRELLAGCPVRIPKETPGARSVYHLFVILTPRREALREHLEARGVETGLHYDTALPRLECFRSSAPRGVRWPVAERAAAEVLSLPMFPEITAAQVRRTARAVKEFFRGRAV